MSQAYNGDDSRSSKGEVLWPEARHDADILVTHLDGELVVYELSTHEVHTLNPTAATVWQWCDGATRPEELAQRLAVHLDMPFDQAKHVLWLSIDRLQRANLLTAPVARPAEFAGVSRRRVLRLVGTTTALLPVIHKIVAPSPAQASSAGTTMPGQPCNSSSECVDCCCCDFGFSQFKCNATSPCSPTEPCKA